MTDYATPLDGIYTYKTPRYDGTFNYAQVRVYVLASSDKMYRIRLRMPVGNLPQGHVMSVCRHNVNIHRPAVRPRHYDYTEAWWND